MRETEKAKALVNAIYQPMGYLAKERMEQINEAIAKGQQLLLS